MLMCAYTTRARIHNRRYTLVHTHSLAHKHTDACTQNTHKTYIHHIHTRTHILQTAKHTPFYKSFLCAYAKNTHNYTKVHHSCYHAAEFFLQHKKHKVHFPKRTNTTHKTRTHTQHIPKCTHIYIHAHIISNCQSVTFLLTIPLCTGNTQLHKIHHSLLLNATEFFLPY